jgi:hypothetical protein
MKSGKYVLVQHSGWGYGSNPQFMGGLEWRMVDRPKELAKLEAMGALLFPDYQGAHQAAFDLMYPENYGGMIPVATRAGTFARAAVDGLRVFIPTKQEVAA